MIKLRHFRPAEFGKWWPIMDPDLLRMLDEFRNRLGAPVMISPAEGALGRHLGCQASSRHNVDRWGMVQAADVMLPDGPDIRDEAVGREIVDLARAVGFGGIGVYLDWRPHPGLHLDCRPVSDSGPATWSRIWGEYVAIDEAWRIRQEVTA